MNNKTNIFQIKMNVFLGLILTILIVSSCDESVLDQKPLDFLTPENAYSGPADAEQAITAQHGLIRNLYCVSRNEWPAMHALGTDVAYFGEDPAGGRMADYVTSLGADGLITKRWWDALYQIVQRSNVLLAGIENSEETAWSSAAEKNSAIAEAMFFRGWAYRILVNVWGDVPLVLEALNYAKTDFVRDSKETVFAQIESDLIFATTNLPVPGNEAAPGKLTQGAAWHLLSEVYLAQKKFQSAVDAATNVIDNYDYEIMKNRFGNNYDHIWGECDVYSDLFVKENHNLAENKEAIWVMQVEPYITGGGTYQGERMYGPAYFRLGNAPDGKKAILGDFYGGKYTGYSDLLGRPVAWTRPTSYVTHQIWKGEWDNDIRNAEHNIKRNFYFDNPDSEYHGQLIDFNLWKEKGIERDDIKDTCQYIFPYFMKIASPGNHSIAPHSAGGGQAHKDAYAMRLAETYLFRAEAYLGLGNTGLAAADINEIRNRANATPVDAGDVDIDYILDERVRELYLEEWRMVTLCRMGLLVERTKEYNDNPLIPNCNIQDYNNLWPIPQDQIDLNIDAVMEQNPGY